jgi:MFS transporter, AAHS family, 4-hydroxybenzoate transporter
MTGSKVINVADLIDNQPIRPFHIKLVVLIFLAMISDGYDLQAIGFAAPGIVKMLHINRAMIGPVLSASLVGILFGAPLFGWVGDRFGRRAAIIGGVFIFGIISLATAAAQTEPQFFVLRFLTGVGLSGVTANSVALVAEYAPKRVRATMIVISQIGLTFGSMFPALASGLLEAEYGWRSLFIVGGMAPLVIGLVLLFILPESLKFMVVAKRPREQILRIVQGLNPELQTGPDTTFVVPQSGISGAQKFHIKQIFDNGLMWITPLLWVLYVTFLTTNFFLHGWMPLLFRGEGLTIRQTAVVAAMFDCGGIIGALVASRLVDRFGVAVIVLMYLCACPAVAAIGMIGKSVFLLGSVIFLAGFLLVGITLSVGAVAGVIYPTEIRGKGIGWAYGIGRFCSMSSPMIGGWLIGMKLPLSELFLAPVVPLALGAVVCFMLMRLCIKRFNGWTLSDRSADEPTAAFSVQAD